MILARDFLVMEIKEINSEETEENEIEEEGEEDWELEKNLLHKPL